MSKRGLVVAIAVLVAAVLGIVLWQGRGDHAAPTHAAAGSGRSTVTVTPRGATDPATGTPRWWGIAGVAPRTIAGVVVDEDGHPVAGATVRLASEFSNAGLVAAASKQTDASGRFDFGPQPAALFVVSAEQAAHTAAVLRVNLGDTRAVPPPDHLRLVMHPCSASIHGTIYDTVGGTIPHATIARVAKGAVTGVVAEADDAGGYELCVPAGGAGVAIAADGYATLEQDVDVYGRTRRDFQLVPGTPVSGRVVNALDNTPVAGAIVEINSRDPRAWEHAVTSSGPDGVFHFDAIAPGRHSLGARGDRASSTKDVEITTELGVPTVDVLVLVNATFTVSGKVVQRGTQAGLGGANVTLLRSFQGYAGPPAARAWAESRDDGSFVIENVAPGTYAPVVGRREMRKVDTSKLVEVSNADVTGVLVEADPTGSIAGRVLADGKPVDGAQVRAQGGDWFGDDTTPSDGTFELTGLGPGTYNVYAESQLVGAFTKGPAVTLAAGEAKRDVVVELDLAGSVSGVVVDQNNAPVAGVFLRFSLLGGSDYGSATTADDGSFTARAMSGGGDYIYEVRQSERSALVYPPATGKRFPPITVADGKTHVTGVRIQVRYERLAITGRVVDTTGKPIADARVTASPDGEQSWWLASSTAMTDQTGAFTIKELPAGDYTVESRSPRGTASVEHVAAGTANVMLKVQAGGGIDGTLEGFTEPVDVFAFGLGDQQRVTATVTGTTFQLRSLPAGRYRVIARTASDSDAIAVDVVSDQITKVTLVLRAKGTVTGTVVDKDHKPLADMRCFAMSARPEDIDYGPPRASAVSDATGAFTIPNAPAGEVRIGCFGEDVNAWTQATVVANQSVTVALVAERSDKAPGKRDIGMELDDQLSDVVVTAVSANGPAAKAGIAVGDALVSVDGKKVQRYQAGMIQAQLAYAPVNEHTLVVERKDKELTVTLKLEPVAVVP